MSNKELILDTIKFEPWKGPNNEIFEGKKTIIDLYEDRLEYKMKFIQEVTVEFIKDEKEVQKKTNNFCDENGFILKDSIGAVSKYIETSYKEGTGEPYNIHMIDIAYTGSMLTWSFTNEEDKNILYNALHDWKFNMKKFEI